jgi:hypothetical protein
MRCELPTTARSGPWLGGGADLGDASRPGAMRPCQQVFENGLVHRLGAGARTSTHTGHIHEGTPCRFPARMPIEAGDRHNRGNTAQ